MLDHLGEHRHLGIEVLVGRSAGFDLGYELLRPVVLHDGFMVNIFLPGLLEEGRIEDFLFDTSVDLERAADLACKLLLTCLAAGLLEGGKPPLHLPVICLQQADCITARSGGGLAGRFTSGHGGASFR
jgi:hypothetical protein